MYMLRGQKQWMRGGPRFQRRNKAAYAGYANIQAIPYYNGAPVVNPILYDISSCPV